MQINTLVNRYILRELIPPFFMNLVFFMFVFLMRQILEITNMIVNYQVSLAAFVLMVLYSMPYFLVYIIPMSVMMSVLLTFLRMSADNEITALKAGGVSLYSLITPVLVFAFVGFVLSVFMAAYGMPVGKAAYERLSVEVVRSNFNVGLKERQFIDSFNGVIMYVNDIDMKSRRMQGVFIEDSRKPEASSTVVAPEGVLFEGKEPYTYILRLNNGIISQAQPGGKSVDAIRFDTYDIRLDIKGAAAGASSHSRDENEMRIAELWQRLQGTTKHDKQYYAILTELHRKVSIPFACIALSILAMPLGIHSVSARKSAGLGIGLICFLFYYLLLSGGMVLAETGRWHPVPLLWAPNIIMGALGLYLFVKAANDRPVALFSGIGRLSQGLRRMFWPRSDEDGQSGS